jgi:outer membrane immunogenic protein
MIKFRTLLLAATSMVALSGSAFAADLAVKAYAPVAPVSTWTGGYVGGEVGVARSNGSCTQIDPSYGYYGACASYYGASGLTTSATGAVAGVNAGYDLQMGRSFVVGAVGDFDWTGLKSTVGNNSSSYGGYYTAKVDWLASVRGRMGVSVDDNLIYLTGGVAFGGVKSSANVFYNSYTTADDIGSVSKTQVGWVVGGGIEHKFDMHWSVKAEALYYDFGTSKSAAVYAPDVEFGRYYRTQYTNEVIAAKLGAAYRF